MGSTFSFFFVNGLYAVIVVMMLGHAYFLPGKGGIVPLVIGVPTLLMLLGSMLRRARHERARAPVEGEAAAADDVASWGDALPVVGWLAALLVMVFFLGFSVSIPLFAFAYVRWSGRMGWISSIAVAAALWATIYVGFTVILERPLFEGVLFGAILPLL